MSQTHLLSCAICPISNTNLPFLRPFPQEIITTPPEEPKVITTRKNARVLMTQGCAISHIQKIEEVKKIYNVELGNQNVYSSSSGPPLPRQLQHN